MRPRSTRQPQRTSASVRRAFTLIELMIVIGIIAVLIAMSLVVGSKVIEVGKGRATQNVIRVLDESRGAWTLNADVPLPMVVKVLDNSRTPKEVRFLLIDGRPITQDSSFSDEAYPALTYYTALVMRDQSIRSIFEQMDSAFLESSAVPGWKDSSGKFEPWADSAVTIKDAWGRPLRIVHPAFHGGHGEFWDPKAGRLQPRDALEDKPIPRKPAGRYQLVDFSRSYRPFAENDSNYEGNWIGDADEGMCIGGSAYFYSAGEDGDPGTRRNNIYSTVPRFPVETRDFK